MTSMLELRRILPLMEKSINDINLEDSLKYLKIYHGLEVFYFFHSQKTNQIF